MKYRQLVFCFFYTQLFIKYRQLAFCFFDTQFLTHTKYPSTQFLFVGWLSFNETFYDEFEGPKKPFNIFVAGSVNLNIKNKKGQGTYLISSVKTRCTVNHGLLLSQDFCLFLSKAIKPNFFHLLFLLSIGLLVLYSILS